jgi:peptidoglycan/xylan/chitin deacetylase (PgdA/CDA1 family)
MPTLPILSYHNIGASPPGSRFKLLYVTPRRFEAQLRSLHRLGLRGVSIGEGVRRLHQTGRTGCVALTFDDGYADNLTNALPLLLKYGFTATCYLVSNAIGSYNHWDAAYLSERKQLMHHGQIREWLAAGMEIGSHSCSHPKLEDLDDAAAGAEIADSRHALQSAFDVPVDHFAYPYGRFRPSTAELVRRAGYRSAVSLLRGVAGESDDLFGLPRIFVNGDHGMAKFLLRIATPYENWRRPSPVP